MNKKVRLSTILIGSLFVLGGCSDSDSTSSTTAIGNNNPVMVTSFPNFERNMNSGINRFGFNVSDADGDDLNVSIDLNDTSIFTLTQNWTNQVLQANYDGIELTYNLVTETNATGTVKVTMNVSDGTASDSSSFNITVKDPNALFVSGETWNGKIYETLVSSDTNRTWLDRNLGASNACTSRTADITCFGDYYQWGRSTDGHEKSNSAVGSTQATSLTVADAKFITGFVDWTTADDNGSSRSANWDVCPNGYSVPTQQELIDENILNGSASYDKLKIPLAGYRNKNTGSIDNSTVSWSIFSNTPASSDRANVASNAGIYSQDRAIGYNVRCIKD